MRSNIASPELARDSPLLTVELSCAESGQLAQLLFRHLLKKPPFTNCLGDLVSAEEGQDARPESLARQFILRRRRHVLNTPQLFVISRIYARVVVKFPVVGDDATHHTPQNDQKLLGSRHFPDTLQEPTNRFTQQFIGRKSTTPHERPRGLLQP